MGQQVKLTAKERMERMGNFERSSLTRPTGCSRRFDPIHLSNGSSRPSAGSIWIVYSFGLLMTWNESWSCSKNTTTPLACIKGFPATRPGRKRAAQHLSQPALRITVGKAIATGCLNCQSPLEWQFARGGGGSAQSHEQSSDSVSDQPIAMETPPHNTEAAQAVPKLPSTSQVCPGLFQPERTYCSRFGPIWTIGDECNSAIADIKQQLRFAVLVV